jgi:hypothetical protein
VAVVLGVFGRLHSPTGVAINIALVQRDSALCALGFRADEPRVLIHSGLGCLFYGAFVPKMLLLTRPGAPRWAVPVLGGAVFTGLVGLWLTSALWLFTAQGVRS